MTMTIELEVSGKLKFEGLDKVGHSTFLTVARSDKEN